LQLHFDDATGNTITASLAEGASDYAGVLQAQAVISKQNPLAQAGGYTAIIPAPTPLSNSLPGGNGAAIIEVTLAGQVRMKGVLGDATPFTCSTYLGSNATFPIYVALEPRGTPGSLWGLAAFQDTPNISDLGATLQWNKPAQRGNSRYRAGFGTQVGLFGSHYVFERGREALIFSDSKNGRAEIDFTGGNLASPLQQVVDVSDRDRLAIAHPNRDRLKLKITTKNGFITGHFDFSFPPKSGSRVTGVVFQKQNLAEGIFVGPTLVGSFSLEPQ
jgi:hypothetical protein